MDPIPASENVLRSRRAERRLWRVIAVLASRIRLLLVAFLLIAAASVAVSLLLPKWYLGQAVVVMPQNPGRAELSLMLRDLGPSAAAFLMEESGDFYRYQAILHSRTVRENAVSTFNLIGVYGTAHKKAPDEKALKILDKNLSIDYSRKYDQLVLSAFDQDPQRAADLANFLVDELNRVNAELLSAHATRNREFLEARYARIEAALDSARATMQTFQQTWGVVELEAQTEAFLDMVSDYRAQVLVGEVEYERLRLSYGDDNPLVQSARNRIRAARTEEGRLRAGSDALLPISFADLPGRLQEFARLKQEALIQARMIELVRPLLEQARFEEIKATPAVQVLDRATPAWRKAKPQRSLLVIALTAAGSMLFVLGLLAVEWWRRNRTVLRSRLHA